MKCSTSKRFFNLNLIFCELHFAANFLGLNLIYLIQNPSWRMEFYGPYQLKNWEKLSQKSRTEVIKSHKMSAIQYWILISEQSKWDEYGMKRVWIFLGHNFICISWQPNNHPNALFHKMWIWTDFISHWNSFELFELCPGPGQVRRVRGRTVVIPIFDELADSSNFWWMIKFWVGRVLEDQKNCYFSQAEIMSAQPCIVLNDPSIYKTTLEYRI